MYINIFNKSKWLLFSYGLLWLVLLLNIWGINAQNGIIDLTPIAFCTIAVTFLSFIATIHYLEQPTNKFRRYFLIGILLLLLDASIICYQFFNQDNTIISLSVRVIFILTYYYRFNFFAFFYQVKTLINFPNVN